MKSSIHQVGGHAVKQQDLAAEGEHVDRAFNRVLGAEAEARERLEACRRAAADLIARAEERAQRVEERAEARILKARRLADASVERELESLRALGAGGDDEEPDAALRARLDWAVAKLVEEIIGLSAPLADADDDGGAR